MGTVENYILRKWGDALCADDEAENADDTDDDADNDDNGVAARFVHVQHVSLVEPGTTSQKNIKFPQFTNASNDFRYYLTLNILCHR